jgi:hypothetical protein
MASKLDQRLRPYLADSVFPKVFFGLRVCLTNTSKAYLTILILEKNEFLPNMTLKKRKISTCCI